MKSILYFSPSASSFVVKDVALLKSKFEVHELHSNDFIGIHSLKEIFRQLIFIAKRNHWKNSIYVIQFAGFHAFIPVILSRLLGAKVAIIVGGTDCVSYPSLNYGNFNRKILGLVTCLCYKIADKILAVDESLLQFTNTYYSEDPVEQGIFSFCSINRKKCKVIYNGYDEKYWKADSNTRAYDFITVAAGISALSRFKLKGIDMMLHMAKRFPEKRFLIVGASSLPDTIELPDNVQLVPFATNDQLLDFYAQSHFYLQLSISEGFPNALCEAMLCGCIPIGSSVAAIPKIVADTGFILGQRNTDLLFQLVNNALQEKKRASPRDQIIHNFSLHLRKEMLLHEIATL